MGTSNIEHNTEHFLWMYRYASCFVIPKKFLLNKRDPWGMIEVFLNEIFLRLQTYYYHNYLAQRILYDVKLKIITVYYRKLLY